MSEHFWYLVVRLLPVVALWVTAVWFAGWMGVFNR